MAQGARGHPVELVSGYQNADILNDARSLLLM